MSVSYSRFASTLCEKFKCCLFTACFYLKFASNYLIIPIHKVKSICQRVLYVAFHRVTWSFSLEIRAALLLSSNEGIEAPVTRILFHLKTQQYCCSFTSCSSGNDENDNENVNI